MAKLEVPDFTASLRQAAPALEVVAEDKIPPIGCWLSSSDQVFVSRRTIGPFQRCKGPWVADANGACAE